MRHVDLIVIGGGAMGLATAWCAAPSAQVVVLERFERGHHRGASHGGERVFRHAHPDPAYVDMALAADEGWQRLQRDAGRQLMHRVGCLEHGANAELDTLVRVADQFGVTTQRFSAREAARRWPAMRFTSDVLFQPAAGWVRAADTLECLATLASSAGAELRFGAQVTAIEPATDAVRVHAGSESYVAEAVVVTAGAWTADLLADVPLPPLKTTEEHVFFFEAARTASSEGIPPFVHWDRIAHYGLPATSGLVKICEHHTGDPTTGDDRTFTTDPARVARIERYVTTSLPGVVPRVVSTTTCLYTTTPSWDFVIDRFGPIVVGAGFSGHGFKFVPEIGRRLADLALRRSGRAQYRIRS